MNPHVKLAAKMGSNEILQAGVGRGGGNNPMMDNISCKGGDNTPISFILVVVHARCVTLAEGFEFRF